MGVLEGDERLLRARRVVRSVMRPRWSVALIVGTVAFVAAVVGVGVSVDGDALATAADRAWHDPAGMAVAVLAFATAFGLRADAWRSMVPGLSFGQSLAAIHVTLGANHVLPLRLGEGLRVVSVVRRARLPPAVATASTLALRTADMLTCAGVAILTGPRIAGRVFGPWGAAGIVAIGAVGIGSLVWVARLRREGHGSLRLPGVRVVLASASAWFLEAVLVLVAARWAGLDPSYPDALLVVGTSVAAQVAAIAPAGFGTYEAAAVATWVGLGYDPGTALVAALGAHALKTAYSLVTGAAATVWPSPGFTGRLRLRRVTRLVSAGPAPAGPVVFFLPARNEAPRIGGVLARVPASVRDRSVRCVVIDDGSTDDTAAVARSAGAEVVHLDPGRGLGAAVRQGLAEAVERNAAAVAFCDADGEYDPAQLEIMVGPILDGHADYVVGSRFAGVIERMHPHRRLGNRLLSILLAFVARRRISDGQSGFRALSGAAAADADIVHDFNYAQVLTLDLLDKGFRYHEVPITYGFRQSGKSFVRLSRYLRAVVPAVYRELNPVPAQSSTT